MAKKISLSTNISDLTTNIVIGLLIGGRLGYVIFYDPLFYIQHPSLILAIWTGGMSFHGGAIGACFGALKFAKKNQLNILKTMDLLAICSTPGILFGRIANFINGELYGRVTTAPWGMIFPGAGPLPRHPSQLYEAIFEGIALFLILILCIKFAYKQGRLFGIFLVGYSGFRFAIEFTREPDAHIGLLALNLSMGQYLSIIMFIIGGIWIYGTNQSIFSKNKSIN